MKTASSKLLFLESLRGIAAISVAIAHYKIGSSFNNTFTDNSWLMVDFFFVLSGFVIAYSYQARINSLQSAYAFQRRRFFRLYPLHLLTLLIFVGFELLSYFNEQYLGTGRASTAFTKNNATSFVQNLFLVQNLVNDVPTWNYPSWSISAEFYTYLVFAGVMLLSAGSKTRLLCFAGFLSFSGFVYLLNTNMSVANGFSRCLYSFFLGVLTLNVCNALPNMRLQLTPYVLFALCIYMVYVTGGSTEIGLNITMPLAFAALIVSLVHSSPSNKLVQLLSTRVLVYFGTISYGIYMLHAAVWIGFSLVLKYALGVGTEMDSAGLEKLHFSSVLAANIAMLSGLAITLFLAHISYTRFERPIMRRFS